MTVMLPLFLPPGRYRVEAVAKDVDGEAASTRKIALVVPSAGSLSDIVLVRSHQPAGENRDVTDPLQFSGGKITPEMNSTIVKSRAAADGIYFAVYPVRDAKPDVRIALSRNGELVTARRSQTCPRRGRWLLSGLEPNPVRRARSRCLRDHGHGCPGRHDSQPHDGDRGGIGH